MPVLSLLMRYVELAGEKVSVIGLGTWQFGSREWGYGSHYAEHDAVDILNRALDLGINLIDTAEMYGFGRSERIVGRAIAGRRSEAFIATKVLPGAAAACRRRLAGRGQRPPPRCRPDRPLPDAPAEPARAAHRADGRRCAACRRAGSSARSA